VKLWLSPTLSGVLWCSSTISEELWSLLPERSYQISSHVITEPRVPIIHSLCIEVLSVCVAAHIIGSRLQLILKLKT
jgi:hypothetical protein